MISPLAIFPFVINQKCPKTKTSGPHSFNRFTARGRTLPVVGVQRGQTRRVFLFFGRLSALSRLLLGVLVLDLITDLASGCRGGTCDVCLAKLKSILKSVASGLWLTCVELFSPLRWLRYGPVGAVFLFAVTFVFFIHLWIFRLRLHLC